MIEMIDGATARRIACASSGFGDNRQSGIVGSLSTFENLGSVQIDTISVVERAHHHILWSRVDGYDQGHISVLEGSPRRVIEYWSHAAAYLPMRDYRYCLPRMQRIKELGYHWFKADPDAIAFVHSRIASEGPLRAQDFQEPMKGPRGWWDWKPAKVALEYLFHCGELISIERRGFQKVYDLAERALPADTALECPNLREHAAYYIDRAISSLGIFSRDEVAYMRKEGTDLIDAELAARLESGSLVPVGIEGETVSQRGNRGLRARFASPIALEHASRERASPLVPRAAILSPFDPLIIDRRRTKRLFAFDYQLECYTPEEKREFGYFALPILFMDSGRCYSFIGLLDAKADRESRLLSVRRLALSLPKDVKRRPAIFARSVAIELCRFAALNGATRIAILRVDCGTRLEASLRAALSREPRTLA
jgi:uncharacterized protein YcaQ